MPNNRSIVILSTAKNLQRSQPEKVNDLLVMPAFVDTLRAAGLDALDALFNIENAESLTKPGLQSWRERLRFQMTHGGERRVFYMKRFTQPPVPGRREVREAANGARSVAGIEWNWMRALAADGIPCTKPVAFGEEFHRGREARSAVLMEAVPGESLEKWADVLPPPRPIRSDGLPPSPLGRVAGGNGMVRKNASELEELSNELAVLIAKFHARGYVHRDLYLAHIFYDSQAAPGQGLSLIDLQRVFRPKLWRTRWIVKDLAALNYSTPANVASRADRLRWLRQYLQGRASQSLGEANGESRRSCMKRSAIRIAGKTQQIARHDKRRQARVRAREGHPSVGGATPSA